MILAQHASRRFQLRAGMILFIQMKISTQSETEI